jgi:hypothetical protein
LAYVGQQAVIGLLALLGIRRAQFAGHGVQQLVSPGEAQFAPVQANSLGRFSHQGADQSISRYGD